MRPQALALGATIAIGSCSTAGCDRSRPAERTELRADPAPARAGDAPREEPDLAADLGRLATTSASPGFVPDPLVFSGITEGGPVDFEGLDERCRGWTSSAPDAVIHAPRPFAELAIMAASTADLTLVVAADDGTLRCGDDEDGTHPVVRGPFDPGTHRVWVGVRPRGVAAPFALALSELEGSRPSALPF